MNANSLLIIWLITAELLLAAASFGQQVNFGWTPPTNDVDGYVLYHGTQPGSYYEFQNMGNGTNGTSSMTLQPGANYFNMVSYKEMPGGLRLSQLANEVVLTNVPSLVLNQVVLSSTNIALGPWLPWKTNSMIFASTNGSQFFRSGQLSLLATNQLMIPTP